MEKILDGKALAKKIRENLKNEVLELNRKNIFPKLAVIMIGNDASSAIYVKNKSKVAEEIGIKYEEHLLAENTKMDELLNLINELNNSKDIHGILVQSPIPNGLDINEAIKAISPTKDVDGFHPINVGKLALNQDCFVSCTPYGIIKLLEEYNISVEGKHAVVVGRSNIVGKPMMLALLNKNATVTVCHSKTKNLPEITKQADILICAIGKSKFITKEMVKTNAVVIDVGINRGEDGKVTGDVDFEGVYEKASYITPVPGGIGPMTIAMLMNNVVKATKSM
ncbi:MAG: bifunctional methylenetetrahydrofolate dehydrogenase/methenyltetrahydrofolate cyclohydrolase FolD [Oscillospiraceae bacterium]|nr:bifunctional methylenetetrahydrofolate dehydrogenase/methenyltetrahydrofolate cyclohydrolase FolD [Oscillospiraceae bacterium]